MPATSSSKKAATLFPSVSLAPAVCASKNPISLPSWDRSEGPGQQTGRAAMRPGRARQRAQARTSRLLDRPRRAARSRPTAASTSPAARRVSSGRRPSSSCPTPRAPKPHPRLPRNPACAPSPTREGRPEAVGRNRAAVFADPPEPPQRIGNRALEISSGLSSIGCQEEVIRPPATPPAGITAPPPGAPPTTAMPAAPIEARCVRSNSIRARW